MPRWLKIIKEIVDHGILFILAIMGLGVAIGDAFGWLEPSTFLGKNLSQLMLAVVSALSIYVIVERRFFLEKYGERAIGKFDQVLDSIKYESTRVIFSVSGLEFRRFDDSIAQMAYVTERIQSAKNSVDDLSWSHKTSLQHHLPARRAIEDAYDASISSASERIQFREIYIFNKKSRIEKLKRRLHENKDGYSCAFFEDSKVPRLQFMIIDREEVVFASSVLPLRCALKHKEVAQAFASYYDELWGASNVLKEGRDIKEALVKKILDQDTGILN